MKRILTGIALFCVGCVSGVAVAGDADKGGEKAQTCVQCHGEAGNKPIANYPKLAGQYRKYLLHSMRAYKSGQRQDPIMTAQMAELSDEDLADLAAYFAAQPGDLH